MSTALFPLKPPAGATSGAAPAAVSILTVCRRSPYIDRKSAGLCIFTARQWLAVRVGQRHCPPAGAKPVFSRPTMPFKEPVAAHLLRQRVDQAGMANLQ